jgi:hypothetical protein
VVTEVANRADLAFNYVEEQPIEVVALDDYIPSARLPPPNYLKVDIDGSELPFLEGARNTLKSPKLKSVIFELYRLDESYGKAIRSQDASEFVHNTRLKPNNLFNVFSFIADKMISTVKQTVKDLDIWRPPALRAAACRTAKRGS